MPSYDAVMLIGFGGPTSPGEIRPFLDNVLRGRPVSPARYESVVHHYEIIGGRSPYNDLTMGQARALATELGRAGVTIPVAVGMRNWTPMIGDTLAELGRGGARRVLGFILSAFQCEASWERYQQAVAEARAQLPDAPIVDYVGPWPDDPLFIEAVTSRASDVMGTLSPADRSTAHLIFTAHSIPAAMAAVSPYVEQLRAAARRVATALGTKDWTLCYQSRSGNPRDPWLEPDIVDVIRTIAGQAAGVVPIGFLCDHVEVLYDLDVEAAGTARENEVKLVRAGTVGEHPAFIRMMASRIRAAFDAV